MKMGPFVNYAHRGASEYYPENTLSSFEAGIAMGANGIETDVQKTKDGKLVLFHDDDLLRVVGKPGAIADYTYEELCTFTVKNEAYGREDRILLLEDFLKRFGSLDLTFAVEIKKRGLYREIIAMLDRFGMKEKVILTSFIYDELADIAKEGSGYRLGWLYVDTDETTVEKLSAIHAAQACPKAELLTPEIAKLLHGAGFSIRAWGVFNDEIMRHAYENGADGGMTVNFPDRLTALLKERGSEE